MLFHKPWKQNNKKNVLGEQGQDTNAVEFHVEDLKVMNAIWILHLLLGWQAIGIAQIVEHAPANLEVTADASSIPQYLFASTSILQVLPSLIANKSSTIGK